MRSRLTPGICLLAAASIANAEIIKDVEYATRGTGKLTLDISVPNGSGPFPAAILVHGGGFIAGDKRKYINFIFEPLSNAGFAWFSIDYRLAPKHRFPAAVEDVESAIGWVKKNARRYKVDERRIVLIGESAGGHLVSFAGTRDKSGVNAVVSFYGIHDFISRAVKLSGVSDTTEAFLGVGRLTSNTAALFRAASPITHVRKGMPPFLLIHGTQDKSVPYDQSVEMCQAIKQTGGRCDLVTLEAGHGMDHWEPDPSLHWYKTRMIQWLREVLSSREAQ
jgi:alpha-L-fucosidase 2